MRQITVLGILVAGALGAAPVDAADGNAPASHWQGLQRPNGFLGGPPRAGDTAQELERRTERAQIHADQAIHLGLEDRFADAEANLRAALRLRQRTYGHDHPETARDLRFMAALYRAQDKLPEAEAFIRWAIDVTERHHGPFSLDGASHLVFFADLCYDQGRWDEAGTTYRQALTIREQILGPTHPAVAEVLDHLIILMRQQGKLSEAEAAEARAQAIRAQHQAALFAE